MCRKLHRADSLKFKSRTLAGGLSAIIPGLGKMYCNRFGDGVYSLLITGLLTWQAYDGFEEDGSSSTRGWIFAAVGGAFYLGNIYGAAVAAGMYNCRLHNEFVKGLKIEITLP